MQMVFFRLGKIEKGDKLGAGGEDAAGSKEGERANSGGSSHGPSSPSGGSEQLTREREREKHEKKKKPKHSDESSSDFALASGHAVSSGAVGAVKDAGHHTSGPRSQPVAGLSVNDFISKTKNQQRQGLKPSGPELIAYARYLGIDPVADHDLLWIAVEALEAPLPSDWTEHFDSNDRVFYYNASMRVSSWTHPLEHIYRETYKTIVNFRNSNMSPQERAEKLHQLQQEVKQMEIDVHKEIAQWTEHTDEQGNRFYFNREARESTWTDPRPAKCQILYLRMKMLRLFGSAGPGFAENKGEPLGSRFAPLVGGSSDFEDPASKRPKVGAGQVGGGRMSSPSTPASSDIDTEDEMKGKKKKKKKKKKKDKRRNEGGVSSDSERHSAAAAAAPLGPRPGAAGLRGSQSEPSVGAKPLHTNHEDRGGLGGMQPSLAPFAEHGTEGALTTVGRARVKAGIRLEPIGPSGASSSSAGVGSPGGAIGAPGAGTVGARLA